MLFFCMDSKINNKKEIQGVKALSIKSSVLLLSVIPAFSAYTNTKFIPPGFEHFYEYQSNQVLFVLPNDTSVSVLVTSNFDGVQSIEEPEKLQQALIRAGISSEHIDAVTQAVVAEEQSDENILYVYDYAQKQVIIEVPANYLSEGVTDLGFTRLTEDRRALISTNRLFATHYQDSTNATLTNDSTLGFGRSHIDLEASLYAVDSGSSQFDVDELAYTYDLEGSSLKAYETHRGNTVENSTSIFNFNREEETLGVSYFSNDNLLVKDIGNTKKVFFDMKARGTIEVLTGDRIIYTDSVAKGQHSVSYRNLPRGNYEVSIVLKPVGFPEEVSKKIIHNNNSETSLRGYDYAASVMKSSNSFSQQSYEKTYLDLAATYSLLNDRLLIGGNTQLASQEGAFGVGAIYTDSNFGVGGYINKFQGGYLFNTNFQIADINFDYEMLDANKKLSDSKQLGSIRYGINDYVQATASYSSRIYEGTLNFYANRYMETYQDSNLEVSNLNLSTNYNKNVYNNVYVDLGYSYQKDFNNSRLNEHIFSISVNVDLNDSFSYISGIDYSTRNKTRFSNTLQYYAPQVEAGNVLLSGNADLSQYVDGNDSQSVYGINANIHNDKFNANLYANGTTEDYQNFTANIESTTIVTSDDVYASRDRAPSYLVVKNAKANAKDQDDLGLVKIRRNGQSNMRETIKGQYTLIELDEYNEYAFNLDTELSGYKHKQIESSEMFSYPGTLKEIVTEFEEVVSVLTYFEDFNNRPINNVECKGCTSIAKVGDGVYNISVERGEKFLLTANEQICALRDGYLDNSYGKSNCFPQIEEDELGLQIVVNGLGNDKDHIYYLGAFEDNNIVERYKKLMTDMEVIQISFNGNNHYFAKLFSKPTLSIAKNKQVILELQNYALSVSDSNKFTKNR